MYIYIYESVVVPIKDNTYFSKFSLWLARSPCVSNIIYRKGRKFLPLTPDGQWLQTVAKYSEDVVKFPLNPDGQ